MAQSRGFKIANLFAMFPRKCLRIFRDFARKMLLARSALESGTLVPPFRLELARDGAVALTPQGGVSTMGKQENADLKVGATRRDVRSRTPKPARAGGVSPAIEDRKSFCDVSAQVPRSAPSGCGLSNCAAGLSILAGPLTGTMP